MFADLLIGSGFGVRSIADSSVLSSLVKQIETKHVVSYIAHMVNNAHFQRKGKISLEEEVSSGWITLSLNAAMRNIEVDGGVKLVVFQYVRQVKVSGTKCLSNHYTSISFPILLGLNFSIAYSVEFGIGGVTIVPCVDKADELLV